MRTRRGLLVALAAVNVLLLTSSVGAMAAARQDPAPDPNRAVVSPSGTVAHAGRWMTDARGRVFIVHGVNMPSKAAPAYPAALNFGDDDATLLAASGVNAVRLTVERYAVEPKAGQFDDGYVAHVRDTVRLLAGHGIQSVVDFHQDEWGPTFFDNGFPDWMTMTDGLPNLYEVGFPGQYFLNPALNRAFDHFWANDVGPSGRRLQDDDATILARVAGQLASESGVLGYEIMNEPWPGSQYPTCTVPQVGCPAFDQGAYSAYYGRVIPKIRAADPKHLIWYEPVATFNQGIPTSMTPPKDGALGFAFHDYPLCGSVADGASQASLPAPPKQACQPFDDKVMTNAEAHSAATGSALLQTEFGATMDTSRINDQLDVFDQHMMPWMFWSYTRYVDALAKDGSLTPATAGNVNAAMVQTLARPYPQLTSGTPTSWNFDRSTKAFTFTYTPRRADGRGVFGPGSVTEIAVPAIAYPGGYRTTVTGGSATSKANAPVLTIRAGRRIGPITVVIAPAGSTTSAASNSTCPADATSAGGVVGVSASPSPSGPTRATGCMGQTGVADGTVSASANPATGDGYAVQDGKPTNPGLLGGFIGVDRQHTLTLVGCAHGDYKPGATDDWNQTPDGPKNNAMASVGTPTFTAPSGPVGPTSPCSPPIVPTPGQGPSCGSARDPSPANTAPGHGSPLNAYASSGFPKGDAGLARDFGGNDGASGYAQVTSYGQSQGNFTTGGTSKGGGGTVGVGNDGNEQKDRWTPDGSPVAVCQN